MSSVNLWMLVPSAFLSCRSLADAELIRNSDEQREAKVDGSPRLLPTNDQQQQMEAMQENAARFLLTCTARRTAARVLLLVLYSCLLRCFRRAGVAAATALAYILTHLASQILSLSHGSWCRLATTAAAGAPVARLWNMHLGACVFIIVMSLPSHWLWWPPKKSDNKLLEDLVIMEQWAKDNLADLQLREGNCFKAKLKQLKGGEEKRIHNFLNNHKKRIEASAALGAQLAKLDSMVAPGDTGLHAAVPLVTSGRRKARSRTDAGLSAQEKGLKRTKTEARDQTDLADRSDICGSAGASNSDFPMVKDSMVRDTGDMGSAWSLSTSSRSRQARRSSNAACGAQKSCFNRMKTDSQEAAEAEGSPRLKLKDTADPPLHSGPYDHFEGQSGAWCGMHALNNLLRGPMVDKTACRLAAGIVRKKLGGADSESEHLNPQTGFLSIDVINLLGSANLGIHVEESHTAWDVLKQCHGARALINWNQTHWTVLEAWPPDAPTCWRHTNSIESESSSSLRYGRAH